MQHSISIWVAKSGQRSRARCESSECLPDSFPLSCLAEAAECLHTVSPSLSTATLRLPHLRTVQLKHWAEDLYYLHSNFLEREFSILFRVGWPFFMYKSKSFSGFLSNQQRLFKLSTINRIFIPGLTQLRPTPTVVSSGRLFKVQLHNLLH